MTERTFVDTNIWVYAVDAGEPAKRERARALVDPTVSSELVVSAQVLGEFFVVTTRKLTHPLSDARAQTAVEQLMRLPVVAIDTDLVMSAIAGSRAWGISYWDALIVRAAEVAGCERVWTEDLSDGATYGSIRVENPLSA